MEDWLKTESKETGLCFQPTREEVVNDHSKEVRYVRTLEDRTGILPESSNQRDI